MARPPTGKITTGRIDKNLLFKGANGTYLNIAIFPNKNGKGQYGDTHFIVQEVTKEQREAGVKGPIIGSFTMPEPEGDGGSWSRGSGQQRPATNNDMAKDDVPWD